MTINNPPILLNEAFPKWAEGKGIFDAIIQTLSEPPEWYECYEIISPDIEYFGNHSGLKKCSPLVYTLLEDGALTDASRTVLAKVIISKYQNNWDALWDTFVPVDSESFLYDYDVTEEETHEEEGTSSVTKNDDFSGTKTTQYGKTVTTGDTSEQSVYGYNSTEDNPTDKEVNSGSVQTRGTDTDSITNGRDITEDTENAKDGSYTKHFRGLKGDRSKQDIIRQEREIWIPSFYEQVFKDVDSVLADLIYNRKHPVNPYAYPYHGYLNI